MLNYSIRRILKAIPQLIIISAIIYAIIAMVPGDFVTQMKGTNKMSAEKIEHLQELYGLDKPLPVRYATWLKSAAVGDFGDSLSHSMPVSQVIKTYVWNSFILSIVSTVLAYLIGIPLGIKAAIKQYSKFDKIMNVFTFVSLAVPSYLLALVLIRIFSLGLGILPTGGMITGGSNYTGMKNVIDIAKHSILPITSLTILSIGPMLKFVRNCMLEVIDQDYVRTARAKGLKEKVVMYKHAFRNALIPIITNIGMSIPGLFSGALITETIFAWPGIGKIAYDSIAARDFTLLMGFNMFMAVLTILGNLLADLLYAVADPRIKVK